MREAKLRVKNNNLRLFGAICFASLSLYLRNLYSYLSRFASLQINKMNLFASLYF